ncbi:MAG: hypothetical protein Ct9H90mP19_3880 [Gammaproteobacteria bacterium]|nr:MAG: hypothetical protein Ct9H90mP19_3880 [Gammaproteobacteria bacterium]
MEPTKSRYFFTPKNPNESKPDFEISIGILKNLYKDLSGPSELKFTHEIVFISPDVPLTSKPTIIGFFLIPIFLARKSKD